MLNPQPPQSAGDEQKPECGSCTSRNVSCVYPRPTFIFESQRGKSSTSGPEIDATSVDSVSPHGNPDLQASPIAHFGRFGPSVDVNTQHPDLRAGNPRHHCRFMLRRSSNCLSFLLLRNESVARHLRQRLQPGEGRTRKRAAVPHAAAVELRPAFSRASSMTSFLLDRLNLPRVKIRKFCHQSGRMSTSGPQFYDCARQGTKQRHICCEWRERP